MPSFAASFTTQAPAVRRRDDQQNLGPGTLGWRSITTVGTSTSCQDIIELRGNSTANMTKTMKGAALLAQPGMSLEMGQPSTDAVLQKRHVQL
jgi:hypothetical protein